MDYENSANPDEAVKREIFFWRMLATDIVRNNEQVITRAGELTKSGFSKKDALHIAAAIEANVDFFITVDRGILKKRNKISKLKISNPIDLVIMLEEEDDEN